MGESSSGGRIVSSTVLASPNPQIWRLLGLPGEQETQTYDPARSGDEAVRRADGHAHEHVLL